MLKAVDLFCGAGGTSQGAKQSGAAKVVCAVNHWQVAVETHAANFPETKHINSRLDQVNPSECPKIDLLFASPECTHHSQARGGRPTNDQARAGSWDIMRWIEYHRPSRIVIENVVELRKWGPIGEDGRPLKQFVGKFFDAWLMAIRAAGYTVSHQVLNSADYGAATSRPRLFVVARKGRREFHWPEPTHGRSPRGRQLPGLGGLAPWRGAVEIIDWRIPCPSLFSRKHPLADKTLARIEMGLEKFVAPFAVTLRTHAAASGLGEPVKTITAGGAHHGIAVPFAFSGLSSGAARGVDRPIPTLTTTTKPQLAIPFLTPNFGERKGQPPRSHRLDAPTPTITTRGAGNLIVPYLIDVNHGESGRSAGGRIHALDRPLGAVTSGGIGQGIAVPFFTTYYGNGDAVSPMGCCANCGMPRRRLVEKRRMPTRPGLACKDQVPFPSGWASGGEHSAIAHATPDSHPKTQIDVSPNRDPYRHVTETVTVGFEDGCRCKAPSVGCLVLDPFSGTGATGRVAVALGHCYLGIELSEDYVRISHRNIARGWAPKAGRKRPSAVAARQLRKAQRIMEFADDRIVSFQGAAHGS